MIMIERIHSNMAIKFFFQFLTLKEYKDLLEINAFKDVYLDKELRMYNSLKRDLNLLW